MKRILSFLLLGILVLSVIEAVAESNQTNLSLQETTFLDDDAPEWNVGDTWIYTIDNVVVDYNKSGQKIFMNGTIDDLRWKVTDTSGDYYTLAVSGKLTAFYDIVLSSQTKTFHLVGEFKPSLTRFTGTIQLTKSDLELHDLSIQIRGITRTKINSLPFAIPIPFKLVGDGQLSVDVPLFDFPLYELKFWNLPDLTITMSSVFGGIFGVIQIPFTVSVHYSWTPFAFFCLEKKDVTVEAGTYSAYKIQSLIGDYFEYYYAPAAGNIIKVDAVLPNGEVHGELKSTNYQ
ncbi:MAG: hypothetical protein QHH19_05840 [Candidatus Thermoplasmatota archaeon]|jgi:hypothetical protein|nr:hypothetical protein [Candidatus Thermoplasmatota archaeon]